MGGGIESVLRGSRRRQGCALSWGPGRPRPRCRAEGLGQAGVRCLYAVQVGGVLYQLVLLGVGDEVELTECVVT